MSLTLKKPAAWLLSLLSFAVVPWAQAQQCLEQLSAKQRQQEPVFVDVGDGTVLELRSRLMWYRCLLGQTYAADNPAQPCVGNPEFSSYDQASDRLLSFRFQNHSGWRLPTNAELRSMLSVACSEPPVNLDVFPDFVLGRYWSSTADYYDSTRIQALDFASGHNAYLYREIYAYLRPVRALASFELEDYQQLLVDYDAEPPRILYGARQADGTLERIVSPGCPRCD